MDLASKTLQFANIYTQHEMLNDILGGTPKVRGKSTRYLPQFEGETKKSYQTRLNGAVLANFFESSIRNIVAKPFSHGVMIEGVPDLEVFKRGYQVSLYNLFYQSVAFGEGYLLIDFPRIKQAMTLQEMNDDDVQPYAVIIPNLAICDISKSGDDLTYIRYARTIVRRNHDEVTSVNQIVIHEIGTIRIYEKATGLNDWNLVDDIKTNLTRIPIIHFQCGVDVAEERPKPVLLDAAYKQIEHYQISAGLNNIVNLAAYPMLIGQGMSNPNVAIPTGPNTVLYAPEGSRWEIIEPQATSMAFMQERLKELEREITFLGLQPLISASGNTPAMLAEIQADRAYAAIAEWAIKLEFASVEVAEVFCEWLGLKCTPQVRLDTSFGMSSSETQESNLLLQSFKEGGISQDQLLSGLTKRKLI